MDMNCLFTSGLRRLETYFSLWRATHQKMESEPALRSELFSGEQMEFHGSELAKQHQLRPFFLQDRLLKRLDDNEAVLNSCCKMFTAVTALSKVNQRMTPAGEWLLDNYYLVEEQIRTARKHLPKGYNRELPQLESGPSEGLPRVYDIALENISHGDGRLDSRILRRFVMSYQTVTPLTLGELWAIPIMLRLALIENLRRVATRVMAAWHDHNLAIYWAERMVEIAEHDRKSVVLAVAEMAHSAPPMTSSFVAELARRLQGQSGTLTLPLMWVEERLTELGLSIDKMVQMETQQQAADQVSISNSMTSLRMLSAMDWKEFVESLSLVEQILRKDPAGIYEHMDFDTRDHYRHQIEKLSKKSKQPEATVAATAIELSRAHFESPSFPQAIENHVGFYLMGKGFSQLENQLKSQSSLPINTHWIYSNIALFFKNKPLTLYLSLLSLVTFLCSWPFGILLKLDGWHNFLLSLWSIPVLLVTSQLAIKFVNWLVTLIIAPDVLPRMDYSHGIPPEARTVVVIPTMIGTENDIDELLEKLEVHYLANRQDFIQFGLLTDFKDAPSEVMEQDAMLLQKARAGIQKLNNKYPGVIVDTFFLCHRPRRWNETEQAWIGYERKRGKLCEFNQLLRGNGQDRYLLLVGNVVEQPTFPGMPLVRYVITLDTDTQLPRDTARQLIGTMAHPLNRPHVAPSTDCVISGYGILQPRVGITLPSAVRSAYSRLFCYEAGIDPYTRAVSDVYQDLFHEGSYIGKGIYEVDAFEQATKGRFPDNKVLSHDLIEGCYARSGLITEVQLYEDYPSNYAADVKRKYRWIRGDWQLLPWIFPKVMSQNGLRKPNPLSGLCLWKLFDNLRRSLVPIALLSLLLLGWFDLSKPLIWTLALMAVVFALPLLSSIRTAFRKSQDMSLRQHLALICEALSQQIIQLILMLSWLPYETVYTGDAIFRTLWRMRVSRRHLIQWNPSSDAERTSPNSLSDFYQEMWVCPTLGILVALFLLPYSTAFFCALPFIIAWIVSPAIAWRISQPTTRKQFVPTGEQQRFLQKLSRRTWAFFDTYITAEENWLPPDNIQEKPVMVIAHRTSPTNIGLALLAYLAAYDFEYISTGRLLDRLEKTLTTLSRLARYHNHLYNWYDTRTLQPLAPEYISTVDNGNLVGHLLTLKPGLLALPDKVIFDPRIFNGLADVANIIEETLDNKYKKSSEWSAFYSQLNTALALSSPSPQEMVKQLHQLHALAEKMLTAYTSTLDAESSFWLRALIDQCHDIYNDLQIFFLPEIINTPDVYPPFSTLRQLAQWDSSSYQPDLRQYVEEIRRRASMRIASIQHLVLLIDKTSSMDFDFLYDKKRDLLSIGYNIHERHLDASYYDLLASEARLTYFVAIAQGQLPQKSWFTLGRLLTASGRTPVLLSWSGSMFEYLMPILVMPNYVGTLLEQTCQGAVSRQIEYGHQLRLPWGISESGYNILDAHFNYQYRAFGVPGLGLKRGLGEDIVMAPYASALALMVAPESACLNLERLAADGLQGRFGMYEAIDYTPIRLPRGKNEAIIYSFMAHHQGMSFLSLASLLLNQPMQRRFLSNPQFQATELLLQERLPKTASDNLYTSSSITINAADASARSVENKLRIITDPDNTPPAVQLLSNGHYHVMVSSSGGGYSRYNDIEVTRWREDPTRDNWGMFCYLRDVASGDFWSATYQPTLRRTELFEAIFSDARAEFRVREHDFDTHTEIVVSPEDAIELRRLHITNRSRIRRTIELTSYAEVVLAPNMADAQHPAFSNLFVQTELVPSLQAILCTRRPRSADEKRLWMCHLLAAHGIDIDTISYETERSRFIGRDRNLSFPVVMDLLQEEDGKLSNSAGAVLDPIVSIRCRITLDAGQTATMDLVSGISDTREGCIHLIEKFRDQHLADRVFDLAWTHSQVLLHQFNASVSDARLYQQLASSIIYANAFLRAEAGIMKANLRSQSGLWGQSISGDLPIVLLKISDSANIDLVTQMVKAHAYWRLKGLTVDLVIWNEERTSYRQHLQDLIMGLIPSGAEAHLIDRPGGIFVRPAQQLSREDRLLLQSVARVIISDTQGPLSRQIYRRRTETHMPPFKPGHIQSIAMGGETSVLSSPKVSLILPNTYGGFTPDGKEYVITLSEGRPLPAPWVNILSNPRFGTVISESGSAYTWEENAHEFRLTPWENDPVQDLSGEALYLRDEESGRYWSPTTLPRRGRGDYVIRHGFGYSVFEHTEEGIYSELRVFVGLNIPVKFSVLTIHNRSGRRRSLSVTGYVEWVLGDLRSKSAMHVLTEADPITGTLYARNPYSMDFPGRVAFFESNLQDRSITCDRTEFIGRNGSLEAPLGMTRVHLSGKTGASLDPCSAIQGKFTIENDENYKVIFLLGAAQDAETAASLAQHFRDVSAVSAVLEEVQDYWEKTLGTIHIETPEKDLDVLANGWLMYQVIASRFWARSGYYQSGGAFGFRDQLQDSMAMVYADPKASRNHLLVCAAHQFPEGDVQHWWHPPLDRGVRTQCSDDYLWLPLAVSRYVRITGDRSILEEKVGYIEGRLLNADEESFYDLPTQAPLVETLYQHCLRALSHSEQRGEHGLPLIGSGDWNDGMNKVGEYGRGESIWLGFFLYTVLLQFTDIAKIQQDESVVTRCQEQAAALRENLEMHGWDGSWYRRAYFDDGTPLGSASNPECSIDSIAQSWSVLSGAAPDWRQHKAMESLNTHLIRRDIGILQLLNPPFNHSNLEPGYIKGYVPGVRENGGQYTHAAIWAIMAFATLGDTEHAWELLHMISPIRHSQNKRAADIYKVEPYVVSADVYAVMPHAGRGGWSWYTGAAGWMYRLIIESLLGLEINNDRLSFRPVLPKKWNKIQIEYRFFNTKYIVHIEQGLFEGNTPQLVLNGKIQDRQEIQMINDGLEHQVLLQYPRKD